MKRTSPIKNKGILAAKRKRKRSEAEARNAATKPENRRQARLAREVIGGHIAQLRGLGMDI